MSKRRSQSPRGRAASGPPTTAIQPPAAPADDPVRDQAAAPAAEGPVDEMAALDAGWDEIPGLS
jgi:hypothetical protein